MRVSGSATKTVRFITICYIWFSDLGINFNVQFNIELKLSSPEQGHGICWFFNCTFIARSENNLRPVWISTYTLVALTCSSLSHTKQAIAVGHLSRNDLGNSSQTVKVPSMNALAWTHSIILQSVEFSSSVSTFYGDWASICESLFHQSLPAYKVLIYTPEPNKNH